MIPLRTDRPLKHTPVVNYSLIAANVLIFVLMSSSETTGDWFRQHLMLFAESGAVRSDGAGSLLIVDQAHLWQFLSYQFLHAGPMHLAGNMLFLWVFGNSVEDRFGHAGYLCFYLAGGVMAGVAHVLTSVNPALGGSGAIAAVTGAYLALFPYTRVQVLWIFIVITVFEIPSLYFLGFAFAKDIWGQVSGAGRVAYMAHIGGNLFGFAVGMGLLFMRILPREPYDLMTLLMQWNRRRQFASMTHKGYDPWSGRKPGASSAFRDDDQKKSKKRSKERFWNRRKVERDGKATAAATRDGQSAEESGRDKLTASVSSSSTKDASATPTNDQHDSGDESGPGPEEIRLAQQRQAISDLHAAGNLAEAADLYLQLLADNSETVLSQPQQLDLANHFFAEQKHEVAANAYRLLLKAYPTGDPNGRVRLMLGLTLARYLAEPDKARPLLQQALDRASSDEDRHLARQILANLPS